MTDVYIDAVDSRLMNAWLTEVHYLHRPVIRSKLIAYGLFEGDILVGGMLWATTPFTKKRGLIGKGERYDKWETLVLARMYLAPDAPINVTTFLAEAIGRPGRKGVRHRGWRVQRDWVEQHPPVFPENPFVPRLLLSWSDTGLEYVPCCSVCGKEHRGNHQGVIYAASGWEQYGDTYSKGTRSNHTHNNIARDESLPKKCWILHLKPSRVIHAIGVDIHRMQQEGA
jgi:hypothetical protein